MQVTFNDLADNPDILIIVIGYLLDDERSRLSQVYPAASYSIDVVLGKQDVLTYERVHGLFSLSNKREAGKARYAVHYAGGSNYSRCLLEGHGGISKSDIGFLVYIPVPFSDKYTRGFDRHPVSLIKKYIKAILTIDPEYDRKKDIEHALEFARKRIRIIIGLNIKDDHFVLNHNTASLRQKVLSFSEKINDFLCEFHYPAWIVPALWGIDHKQGHEIYLDDTNVCWMNSRSDKVRSHLRHVKTPYRTQKIPFPFATMRSFLIESASCQAMLQELSALNEKVYFLSGDADLVSLKPTGEDAVSVFNSVHKIVTGSPDSFFVRLGGAYGFKNEDIARHISDVMKGITPLNLTKSVLMTQLLRGLDIAARTIMSQIDPQLAYYSEAHTFVASEVFDQTGEHFLRRGNKKSPETVNTPITKTMRNSRMGDPDVSPRITRDIRQKRNWKKSVDNLRQVFIAERSSQLLTSSRHDLVVVSDSEQKECSIRFFKANTPIVDELKKTVNAQHNSQLTATQLNSRFREAGYEGASGENKVFHKCVALLPVVRFPFVVYFFTNGSNEARMKESRKEVDRHAVTSAGIPDVTTFTALYQKIIEISESPRSLFSKDPLIDITEMRQVSQRINLKRAAILKAFFQMEYLLRWATAMVEKINSLIEVHNPERQPKPMEKGDDRGSALYKKNPKKMISPVKSLIAEFNNADDEKLVDDVKSMSLSDAVIGGKVGPREINSNGWYLQDVEGNGNCFYRAVIHQLQTLNHPFLSGVPDGGAPHLYLRNRLNDSSEGEWADDKVIAQLVKKIDNVIVAVVDTRNPEQGYTCYSQNADGTVGINPANPAAVPQDHHVIRIAYTGNHFLSVTRNPALNEGALRDAYPAPRTANTSSMLHRV